MAVVLHVAILFFLVYLFFAFCVKQTGMPAEENFSLTCCHCQLTAEAREISKQGKPRVHCPCDKCNGRATWRMTSWRHLKLKCEQSSQPTLVKNTRRTLEEPEWSTLEPPVEYERHEFEPKHVFRFADSYMYREFPHCGDVCAGAERADHDHDDIPFPECSSASASGSADGDDKPGPSDDEIDPGDSDDAAENLKQFVQDSALRLVEMKQKMGCSISHFEELLQWGKDLHTNGNNDAATHWPRNWDDVQALLKEFGFF